MVSRVVCVALLLSVLPAAGCGTAANLVRPGPEAGGHLPFGGVKHDLVAIRQASKDADPDARTGPDAGHYPGTALMLLCAADLPFSFVGDLVTWPYVTAYSFINRPVPTPPVVLSPSPFPPAPAPIPAATPPDALPDTVPPGEPLKMPRKFPG